MCYVVDDCNIAMYVVFVYGALCMEDMDDVWKITRVYLWSHPGNHLILGDFNQLQSRDQKKGVQPLSAVL